MNRVVVSGLFVVLCACGEKPEASHPSTPATTTPRPVASGPSLTWEKETLSPAFLENGDADLPQKLASACPKPERSLTRAAAWLAAFPEDDPSVEADRLSFAIRASGGAFVATRLWSVRWQGQMTEPGSLLEDLRAALEAERPAVGLACGVGWFETPTEGRLVALSAPLLVTMSRPIPTRVRTGQWLEFEAVSRLDISDASVLLQGPSGAAINIPTSLKDNRVLARFPARSEGAWTLQLMGATDSGPRPLLAAEFHVDREPPPQFVQSRVPGEGAEMGLTDPLEALTAIVNAMRRELGRPPLERRSELDAVAQAHAEVMLNRGELAHEAGDGTPASRLAGAGIAAQASGENLARASDPVRVHRALWASPSHRANLANPEFTRWGLGLVRDKNGDLWVCQVFVRPGRTASERAKGSTKG